MMDFERWFLQQKSPEEKLLDALEAKGFEITEKDGVKCYCCICGQPILLSDYLTLEECLDEEPVDKYCGGSPRCIP